MGFPTNLKVITTGKACSHQGVSWFGSAEFYRGWTQSSLRWWYLPNLRNHTRCPQLVDNPNWHRSLRRVKIVINC